MSSVTAQIVLRFVAATRGQPSAAELLASIGLNAALDIDTALRQTVDIDAYFDLLERAAGADDDALGIRYGQSVGPEDFGLMGLALKTASNLREALQRIIRYVLVLSDSLDYSLESDEHGSAFVLQNRTHHRRGACLANEGALAAVLSLLRQISTVTVTPQAVAFRHARPADVTSHARFFGCPVVFDAEQDQLRFAGPSLDAPTRLADTGLSAFLLNHLDEWRVEVADRSNASIVAQVRRAVADSLCDGPPRQEHVARLLGMSERTLHRRLADRGESFQSIADTARRSMAESLLAKPDLSLAEISFLTGFSEQSAFQRAFKRWSGQTPAAFRRGLTA